MNKEMIELYSDYLISTMGQATATGLSALMQGSITHDKITRFLNQEVLDSKALLQLVKPSVRRLEKDHPEDTGYLIFDDTVQAKPHSAESDTICWHYDHSENRNIKGINLLNCLYHKGGVNIPIAFDIITKPITYTDSDGKQKRQSERTKNQRLISMFDTAIINQVDFTYVLMDSWFAAKDTFKHIRKKKKHFISALKSNRLVSLDTGDSIGKRFVRIDTADLPDKHPVLGYLTHYDAKVLLLRQVFINKDGSTGTLYLVCSDTQCDAETIMSAYQTRWRIEEYHKSLKQNASLAKSPAFSETARHNHVCLSIYATFKLECLKLATKLSHFAIRARLLIAANQSAFAELLQLRCA